MHRLAILVISAGVFAGIAVAQEREFKLSAHPDIVETGFLKYLLPRFSLKTGIRITVVNFGEPADASFSADSSGTIAFSGVEQNWYLGITASDRRPHAERFAKWLASDVGRRTIGSFKPDGVAPFSPQAKKVAVVKVVSNGGDAAAGEKLSLRHCGRCHVVNETNRMNAIGSTPSFSLLRSFEDWEARFQTFYVLNPHPAFTQIEEVTEPFSSQRPSPIAPLEMTLEDLEAIMAYAATISPANLGAPIKHQ
ncbi:MAG: hypothetical protein AB3N20_01890 [Rhizobiaceae bacterium]